MADGLTFEPEGHVYKLGTRVVPSVTQILGPLSAREYRFVDKSTMEAAAALGTAVHKMIELDVADDLDVASLSEPLLPYFAAWRNFRNLSGFECCMSEQRVHSAKYGYAGTLDLAGELNNRPTIIDAKRTAQVPRTAGPQTSAYRQALSEAGSEYANADRYALHLRVDGSWRLVPFVDKNDLRVFLSALTLHHWENNK